MLRSPQTYKLCEAKDGLLYTHLLGFEKYLGIIKRNEVYEQISISVNVYKSSPGTLITKSLGLLIQTPQPRGSIITRILQEFHEKKPCQALFFPFEMKHLS